MMIISWMTCDLWMISYRDFVTTEYPIKCYLRLCQVLCLVTSLSIDLWFATACSLLKILSYVALLFLLIISKNLSVIWRINQTAARNRVADFKQYSCLCKNFKFSRVRIFRITGRLWLTMPVDKPSYRFLGNARLFLFATYISQ